MAWERDDVALRTVLAVCWCKKAYYTISKNYFGDSISISSAPWYKISENQSSLISIYFPRFKRSSTQSPSISIAFKWTLWLGPINLYKSNENYSTIPVIVYV